MKNAHDPEHYIYSCLAGDSDLKDIVDQFSQELPKRAAAILAHLNSKDWESLCRTAHQLKGAAGSYGFELISPCAGRLEAAVRDGEQEEAVRKIIDELTDLCGRVRGGTPPAQ